MGRVVAREDVEVAETGAEAAEARMGVGGDA